MRQLVEGFREPDVEFWGYALWYGPGGAEGDCATEVEQDSDGSWRVTEYQNVMGLLEDVDPAFPFLTSFCYVEARCPRVAARLGTDRLAEYGSNGMEDLVSSLPGGE